MANIDLKILERIEELLEHILAVQLYRAGVDQQTIAGHLRVSKTTANKLLKGIETGKKSNEGTKPQNS